jgi:hypothetical protein
VRIAGELRWLKRSARPTEVLPVHPVGVEYSTNGADNRHATVTEPPVHVLSLHRHASDDSPVDR